MKRYKRIQIEEREEIMKEVLEGKASLKIFMELKIRFVKIIKVINKTGEESMNATMKVFEYTDYPIYSITYDNLVKMLVRQ